MSLMQKQPIPEGQPVPNVAPRASYAQQRAFSLRKFRNVRLDGEGLEQNEW
jgi:hypothetical protein